MPGTRTPASKLELRRLRREATALGIWHATRFTSIRKLREILADPYPYQVASWKERYGLDPFDFRGITPKKNAFIRWQPKRRYEREGVAGYGRFEEWVSDSEVIVKWLTPFGKWRKVKVHPFQIIDYREDK